MTECFFCQRLPEWHLVAGTTECPDIIEGGVCETHRETLAALTNAPHTLLDGHGHHMQEIILGGQDREVLVLLNDRLVMCHTCNAVYLTKLDASRCETRHALSASLKAAMSQCPGCGRRYQAKADADRCMKSHHLPPSGSLTYACPACQLRHATREDASSCCQNWLAKRAYEEARKRRIS